jgi:hypothetical protein
VPLTGHRTLFALYALDAIWYEILSMPRSLSHLEIKHDMPCSDELWRQPSATDWAHRTLVGDRSTPPVKYVNAVRGCMSTPVPNLSTFDSYGPVPNLSTFDSYGPVPNLSTFDSYGLYLVILFLLTGVREVSGWSTMTGRACLERFEVSQIYLYLVDSC